MMTSYNNNIESILQLVAQFKPKRILDIGSAYGKYSLLIREAMMSLKAEAGDPYPHDELTIDCCENSAYFHKFPIHKVAYDNHFHCSLFNMSPELLSSYDMILLIDVVEHCEKQDINDFLSKINTRVLISTPRDIGNDDRVHYGFAPHISQWEIGDFDYRSKACKSSICSHIYVI